MAGKLSATAIRNMKQPTSGERYTRRYDGGGLFAYIMKRGTRPWKLRYTDPAGKERWLTLGEFPAMTLEQARLAACEIRNKLAKGLDPKIEIRQAAELPNFQEAAQRWLDHAGSDWASKTRTIAQTWLDADLAPAIGALPLASIEAAHIMALLRKVDHEGHGYKLRRLHSYIKRIFSYSISHGWVRSNPAAEIITRDLFSKQVKQKRPAFTHSNDVARLMRMIHGYDATMTTRNALMLAALCFVRPGELIAMRWADIDLEACQWRYLVTKTNTPHVVPLSRQAVAILRDQATLSAGWEYVFLGNRSKTSHMSNNTLNAALRYMGVDTTAEHCAHGFRAMARTQLAEMGFNKDFIELQLAHSIGKNESEKAYGREQHLSERVQMMQAWADHLDMLRNNAV